MPDDIDNLNTQRKLKNESVTLMLALMLGFFGFLGIGHIYIGRIRKGVLLLFGGWILEGIGLIFMIMGEEGIYQMIDIELEYLLLFVVGLIFFLIWFIVFIYSIINARNNARDFNDYFLKTKNNLW